ncbi:MAG: hypothetical protein RBS68_02900 [Anaerolineales bacterium]|jgi:hypothetical protein|nr:hypothetical protein [Anaerolineales bacterium]
MKNEHEQARIESHLAQAFQRVTPSRAFVDTVRGRIHNRGPEVVVYRPFSHQQKEVLLTLGGVLSASLLILTLARVFYYLLGRSKQTI